MPADFTKPIATDNYVAGTLTNIRDAFAALAQMLDPAVAGTLTGTPTGAYRVNGVNLERFNGSAWATYTLNIAGSATQVGGLVPQTSGSVPAANQLVRSNASGDTILARISTNVASSALATPAQFMTNNGTDAFVQKSSAAQAAAAIQAAATGSWAISVTGVAGSVAWTSVTGRPTAVSAFTNDAGYITAAATVAGIAPASADVAPGNNQLVRTGATGNAYTNYINATHTASELASPAQFIVGNGTDNFYRRSSAAQAMAAIRTSATGSWAISVTGNAATASAVAWTSVTGRPTALSSFTNDPGYLTAASLSAAIVSNVSSPGGVGCYALAARNDTLLAQTTGTTVSGSLLNMYGFTAYASGFQGFLGTLPGTWRLMSAYGAGSSSKGGSNLFGGLWLRIA